MSLETSLELNNQLLTQHNALLERLITALASGVALRPDTVAQVQEYRETVPKPKRKIPLSARLRWTIWSSATLSPGCILPGRRNSAKRWLACC
jgi:hypothetical protein